MHLLLSANGEGKTSNAKFYTQTSVGDTIVTSHAFSNLSPIQLAGRIQVAPEDIGKNAEIIVVALHEGVFFVKSKQGWQLWDGQLKHLVASKEAQLLQAIEDINIISELTTYGSYKIYIGYRVNGDLHHSKQGFDFHIYNGLVDESQTTSLGSTSSMGDGEVFSNSASFSGQFVSNHQVLTGHSFTTEQAVDVFGRISIEASHIGQTGEILQVASYQGQFYMKTPTGWVPWDGQLSSLVAAEVPRAFKPIEDVEIERNLTLAGDFDLYFGYRVNNQFFYNEQPLMLSLVDNTGTEPPKIAADLACDTPWGTTLLSGASATAYQSASVNAGSACVSEERLCSNGVLLGNYINQTCEILSVPNVEAPQNINVTPKDEGIEITWDAVGNAASYNLYYSLEAGFSDGSTEKVVNIQAPYDLTGLNNGETYYLALTAVNTGGVESNFSDEKVAIPTNTILSGKLNDTGIISGGNYPGGNNSTCTGTTINQQDCSHGRDFTHNDDSDGHAGFSFTKLDANGNDLSASAGQWRCVRDNVTGLIWEAKTDDNSIHDKDNTYRWGGITALGSATIGTYYSDWRVPTSTELVSLVDFSRTNKAIDMSYFPHTASYVWSSSPYAHYAHYAWYVYFGSGYSDNNYRFSAIQVRLVRSGQ